MAADDAYYVDDLAYDDVIEQADDYSAGATQKFCKVYDKNDFFTIAVQLMLAALALVSLYWKRIHEVPRRTLRTWLLDMSKQALGACYAHVLNMMIASIISENSRGDYVLEDQCAWYGLSYLIDTTLGLVLAVWFLHMLQQAAHTYEWTSLQHSGVYSGPDAMKHWTHQVTAWMLILSVVKVIIYLFMWAASSPLAYLGDLLFTPLQFNIRFELLFVMIFFPGFLNVIYFWIADSYLKAHKDQHAAHEPSGDTKQEALILEVPTDPQQLRSNSRPSHRPQPNWTNLSPNSSLA